MFWIILITTECTYLLTELNEWDSVHSYYKREAKIAPQFNLKVRKTDQLKQLNFIYSSNCIVGGLMLIGISSLMTALIHTNVFPAITSIVLIVALVLGLIITNSITTISDNLYDKHLHILTILRSRTRKK